MNRFRVVAWVLAMVLLAGPVGAGAVMVTVVTRTSDEPVSGATVSLKVGDRLADGVTDMAGEVSLDVVADKGYLTIEADAPEFAHYVQYVMDVSKSAVAKGSVQIKLEPAMTVGGTVVDEAKQPVANANIVVDIFKRSGDDRTYSGPRYKTIKTDAQGKWQCEKVPAEPERCSIGCWKEGYLCTYSNDAGFYSMDEYKDVEALKKQSAVFTLKRGVRIEGIVRGKDRKPVAHAGVGVGRDRVASNALPESYTDASGKFVLAAHPTGELPITIKAAGYAPELIKVDPAGADKKVEVDLKPAATIRGRVVNKDGKPVSGAMVFVDTWRECRTINANLQTDFDGRFLWKDAPADAVQADIDAQGYARLSRTTLKPGEENAITLLRPVTVRGTVIDDVTKEPIKGFKVVQGIGWDNNDRVSWQRDRGMERIAAEDNGTFQYTIRWPYPKHKVRVEAEGYLPEDSAAFKIADGDQTFTFRMKHGKNVAGTVVDDAGKPVADTMVCLSLPGSPVTIVNGEWPEYARREAVFAKTDAAGHFSLPPQTERFVLVVVNASGYAETAQDKLTETVKLEPWGSVEGQVMSGSKAMADQKLAVHQYGGRYDDGNPRANYQIEGKSDSTGHFKIERVPAGKWSVARAITQGSMTMYSGGSRVEVEAGKTAKVQVGGKGRAVVGRVQIPEELTKRTDWAFQYSSISTDVPMPRPKNQPKPVGTQEEIQAAFKKWMETEDGKSYVQEINKLNETRRNYPIVISADGSFRAEEVEAGNYRLVVQAATKGPPGNPGFPGKAVADAGMKFTMPAVTPDQVDVPYELADVKLMVPANIQIGQPAPLFEVKGLDGKAMKLEDYRGKFVILAFWASWSEPYVKDLPAIKETLKLYRDDPRVQMVSLSVDFDIEDARRFAEANAVTWPQGYVGPVQDQTLTHEYGIQNYPSLWLISPEGKVLAKDLRGGTLRDELAKQVK